MSKKYLRGLSYTTSTSGKDIPIFMKTCYEFWAYCVNGITPLVVTAASNTSPIQITTSSPHGLSANQTVGVYGVTGNTAANGQWNITSAGLNTFTLNASTGNGPYIGGGLVNIPGGIPTNATGSALNGVANFFEGTSVLAVGNDGVTSAIGATLTAASSAPFNSTMIGKYVVIWASGNTSSDDSIYKIINTTSTSQLVLSPFSGGTPDISTQKNNITSRSALNYRVIDIVAASQLAVANGHYFIGTLSGASTVNTGQASSQFQFFLRGASAPFGNFGIVGSPNGSWTGSAFSGTGVNAAITEKSNANSVIFSGTTSGINGYITLIGDKDFFMGHVKSPNSNSASGPGMYFYVIVPQRFYTLAQDANLLTIMVGANSLLSTAVTDSHSTSFYMTGFAGATNNCQLMTRNFVGDNATGTSYTVGPNLVASLAVPTRSGKAVYSDAVMSTIVSGQYSLARARLRQLAFTSNVFPNYHLFGDNGEFIHVGNGTLWPWDGSILPYNLLPLGQ